ncbi:hypothetical protein HDV63DRAFT_401652 [Trichoderma sp. SZMC 28014]
MAHANRCPSPGIPPLRIELSDIPVDDGYQAYPFAIRVIEGYWGQATNMTTDDQLEYKFLIEDREFERGSDDSLFQHYLFNDLLISPTWAKYVFLHSLFGYEPLYLIDRFAIEKFGSTTIDDLQEEYRTHHRDPSLPDAEISGEMQTQSIASSHPPLLNLDSFEWLDANCDQSKVTPMGQSSPAVKEAITQYDLEKLETRLKASMAEMENRILEQIHQLRAQIMAIASDNGQMSAK